MVRHVSHVAQIPQREEQPRRAYGQRVGTSTTMSHSIDPRAARHGPCSQSGGSHAGILLPVQWIARSNPGSTVAVFLSDHFVSEPAMLMAHITQIADWVEQHQDRLVLLGARATGPEVEYGWIELERPLDWTPDRRIWTVRRFWEKPSEERARMCLEAGCLWNTFIVVGKAATFLRAGREAIPEVDDRLEGRGSSSRPTPRRGRCTWPTP